jgi:hypothetical protein
MGWQELQKRLMDAFTVKGILGKKVLSVIYYEKAYGEYVEETWRGHSILSHSFQEFYIETIQAATSVWQEKERKPTPPNYSETILWHFGNFRNLRAVDILFHNGYPMDGFARLRHIKESAIWGGAMLGGVTTYTDIKGLQSVLFTGKPVTSADWTKFRKNRKKEERRVFGPMIRKESGLPLDYIAELETWQGLFHEEVHGAGLTQALDHGPAIKGEDTISVAPKPSHLSCAMFINRFCEVGWMLHRTLPAMQLSYRLFGPSWDRKWHLIDENFEAAEEFLRDMGKRIGGVFIEFINIKFPFSPNSSFAVNVKTK